MWFSHGQCQRGVLSEVQYNVAHSDVTVMWQHGALQFAFFLPNVAGCMSASDCAGRVGSKFG